MMVRFVGALVRLSSRALSYIGVRAGAARASAALVVELRRKTRRGDVVGCHFGCCVATALLDTGGAAPGRSALAREPGRPARSRARRSLAQPRSARRSTGPEARSAGPARVAQIKASAGQARLRVLGFGEGPATPWDPLAPAADAAPAGIPISSAALMSLATLPEERPASIVVLTDGRLDRPSGESPRARHSRGACAGSKVPVHTVSLASTSAPDASIRAVRAAGAAVAHQPLPLAIQIGCDGGLSCDDLTVSARELIDGGPPALLASGVAHIEHGLATVELTITLDRAGSRIVEVAIEAPDGDEIPDNDRRLVAFDVARDRVRVLHVAGRPTYDVRALRMWLKSDASVDVVAFFILRTHTDDVNATEDDLALIPFPVDELFSEHLPSFDAVVLQDFNAAPYELLQHLPALAQLRRARRRAHHGGRARLVRRWALRGHAARPRCCRWSSNKARATFDPGPLRARLHRRARAAPVLAPLRELRSAMSSGDGREPTASATRDRARSCSGAPEAARRGRARPCRCSRSARTGRRDIALAVDGTYRLAFSASAPRPRAARTARSGTVCSAG